MSRRPYLPFALALLALGPAFPAPPCRAAKVKVWHHHAPAHYERAQWGGVALSSEGTLRLARQLRPLAALDATHVWDLAEDRDGPVEHWRFVPLARKFAESIGYPTVAAVRSALGREAFSSRLAGFAIYNPPIKMTHIELPAVETTLFS